MKKIYPLFFASTLLLLVSTTTHAIDLPKTFAEIFIENKGQVKDEKGNATDNVLFYSQGKGIQLFVTTTGYSLVTASNENNQTTFHKIEIKLEHANIQRDHIKYVKGDFPKFNFYHSAGKLEDVRSTNTVIIRDIYPGIDWLWEFDGNKNAKHSFMVNLGADAGLIRYTVDGATPQVRETNNIVYSNDYMRVLEGPVMYQHDKKDFAGGITVQGNHIGFQIPPSLNGGGFSIDPPLQLLWGASLDTLRTSFKSVVFDTFSHTLAPNYTSITVGYSSDYAVPTFPQVNGSYSVYPAHQQDLLIMKTDAAQDLIWATFFGGAGNDQANAVTVTPQGMFVTGYSESWDFPQAIITTGYNAHVALFNRDAFIAYFDTLGKWSWSTGYGGNQIDEGTDIKYYNHRVFVSGYTQSPDFPLLTENGAYNAPPVDSLHTDGFLLAFDEYGNRQWATCFGGSGNDYFTSMYVDSTGLYATGYSQPQAPVQIPLQPWGPAYFQHAYQNDESFITRFDGNDALLWSTFFGGPGNDIANCIVKNSTGLFVCGKTDASGLPVLSQNNGNYYQPNYAGGANDGFIARFDGDSFQQRYTTYYGTDSDDVFTKMCSGAGGDLIFTGYTNGHITHVGDPFLLFQQDSLGGGYDGLMLGLTATQDTFWATYFGSEGNDFGYSLALLNRYLIDMVGEGFYNYGKWRIGGTYVNDVCTDLNYCPQVSCNGATNRFLNPIYIGWVIGGGGGGGGGGCNNFLQFHALIPQQNSCPNQCDGHAIMDTTNIGGCPPYTLLWNNGDLGLSDTALCEFYWSRVIDANNRKRTIYGRFNVMRVLYTEPVATYCPYSTYNIDWDSVIHLAGGGPPYTIDFAGTNAGTCPTQTYFYIYDTAHCVLHYTAPWYQYNSGVTVEMSFSEHCEVQAAVHIAPGTCHDIPDNAMWVISDGTDTVHIHATGDEQPDILEDAVAGHHYSGYLDIGNCQFPLVPKYREGAIKDSIIAIPACSSSGGSITVNVQPDTGAINFLGIYSLNLEIIGIDTAYNQNSTLTFNSGNTYTSVFNNLPPSRYRVHLFYATNCDSTSATVDLRTVQFHFQPPQLFCNRTDTLVATTDGGLPPFNFHWSSSAVNDSAIVIDSGGTYALTVTDAAGCVVSHSLLVISTLELVIDTVEENLIPCQPNTLLSTALVSFHGGVAGYTILWSSGETTNQAHLIPPGANNSVIVTDVVGCADTFNFANTKQYPPYITDTFTNVTCYGYHNGTGTIYIAGGYTPFHYDWSNGDTTSSISNLPPDTYTFNVTDNMGCGGNGGFQISEPDSIQYLVQTTADTCGSGNGTATVQIIGGTGPYTLLWDDNSTGLSDTALTAGPHSVMITDALGCSLPVTADVGNFSFIDASVTITNVTCNGAHDGTATLQVISATFPVTVTWSIGVSNPLTNLGPGSYSVTLTDANSCKNIIPIEITEPDPLEAVLDTGVGILCNGQKALVTLSAVGGTFPYTGTFSDSLTAGNYPNIITDTNGCTVPLNFSLSEPTPVLVDYYIIKFPTCTNNGEMEINATGGNPPYYYDDGASSFGMFYDSAHAYYVDGDVDYYNVMDNNGCAQTLTVNAPFSSEFNVADSIIQPTCSNADGTVTIYAAGTPPYTLVTQNGNMLFYDSLTITLAQGSYTYVVRDSATCDRFLSINILEPEPIHALVSATNISCNGAGDGSVSLAITNPVNPITITWSNGDSVYTLNSLDADDYSVTVTDGNGCHFDTTVTVFEPDTLFALVDTGNGIPCNGGNAFISITATGGTFPYQGVFNGTESAGSYTHTVTDNRGCTASVSYSLTDPAPLVTGYSIVKLPSCSNNGEVEVYASGGTAPYSTAGALSFTDSLLVDGLAPGSTQITISDNNQCTQTITVSLSTDNSFSVSRTIHQPDCHNFYGTTTFYATGGTPPYSATDGVATFAFNDSLTVGNAPGSYTYNVSDDAGCHQIFNVTYNPWVNFSYTMQISPVLCHGQSNGSATIHMFGGTPPYTHNGTTFSNTLFLNNFSVGTYSDSITDGTGCKQYFTFQITEPETLLVDSMVVAHELSCGNVSDGVIVIYASGGTPDYLYNLTSQNGLNITQPGNVFTNLPAGVFTVLVTDSNGCTATQTITINPFVTGNDSVAIDSVTCYDGNNGALRIYSTPDDRSPFRYSLNGEDWQPYNVYYNLHAGNYQVVVSDKNNCRDTFNVSIWQPADIDAKVWLNGELLPVDSIVLNERLFADFTKEENQYPWQITLSPDIERLIDSATHVKIQPREDITFIVRVYKDSTDKNCFKEYRGYIELLGVPAIPNTITPNGDGINDIWKIDLDRLPGASVTIFDRWGEIIYESAHYANDWDGLYHGKKIADGTYYYILKVAGLNNAVYKGDINVLNSSH